MTPAPALEVEGLTIRNASGGVLVRDVSFTVGAGLGVGLIGQSGSGKSLTALAVCGLLPPGLRATGSVRLDGQEVVGARERVLTGLRGRRAAVVFQDPSRALDPLCRVGAQLAEPLRRHQGLSGAGLREGVRAALADVALGDAERVVRAFPYELSGGQRQRVAIAMALACRPGLLIADEPTTALDVTVQADIVKLLQHLSADRGMALLFISHDIALIAGVVGEAMVMKDGELIERGAVADIVARPQHEYTRELVRSARVLELALTTGTIR